MPAHTPGPWTAERFEEYGLYGFRVMAGDVQISEAYPKPTMVAVSEANARLIAAAPRMLDLLRHVPHNNMTATHRMVESVAGCPGCEARAILRDVEGDK